MATSEYVLQLINDYMSGQNPNVDKNILINQIFSEMHQIEWDIPAGKTVLLYSGNIMSDELVDIQSHFSRAYEIVAEMREANDSLFIDSDAGAGKVLSSDLYRIFKDQLAGEGRLPSDLATVEHGLWTEASQQLASKAVGDVITISPFASLDGANGPTV